MIIAVKIKGKPKKVKAYIFGIFIDVFYNPRSGKRKRAGYAPPRPFNQIFKSSPKYCLYFKSQQPLLTSQMNHHNQFAQLLQLKLSRYYVKGAVILKYHPG